MLEIRISRLGDIELAGGSVGTVSATHMWWHRALFHLAQAEVGAALELYDRRIRVGRSLEVADMIDAASLLWRIELLDVDTGARWLELASAWAAHIEDAYCTFVDVHAMLALVGARDCKAASRLEDALLRRQALNTRYGIPPAWSGSRPAAPSSRSDGETMLGRPSCSAPFRRSRGKSAEVTLNATCCT